MKNLNSQNLIYCIMICLFSLNIGLSQNTATITKPSIGEIFDPTQRLSFTVSTSIDEFNNEDGHYWVVEATVNTPNTYYKSDVLKNRKEVIETMEKWQPTAFWPKYYIKRGQNSGQVFDGGQNIHPPLEPMMILIVKVDETLNNYIINWFQTAKPNYEPIPISLIDEKMIVGKCGIFFE